MKSELPTKTSLEKGQIVNPENLGPSTSKPNLTLNKRILCIWWDIRGPIHYELLKPNEKLNSEKYCQQLDNLKTAVQEKRPAMFNRKDIILQHDNARPHAALRTRQKLQNGAGKFCHIHHIPRI